MAGGQKTFAALPQMKSGHSSHGSSLSSCLLRFLFHRGWREGPRGVGRCQDRVSQNILRHLEKNKLDIGGGKKTRLKDRFLLNYIQCEALYVFLTDFTHLFLSHHGKLLM